MSLPTTRRVLVCNGTDDMSVQQRPIPKPTGSEVLLQIEASGICATDLHLVRRSVPYLNRTVDVCGHEGIGRIVELGPEIDAQWKVGDRVAHRWLYRICKQCEMCQSGSEQLCAQRQLSGKDVEGCWADYTVVDSRYLLRVPEDLKASEAAPILCAGTTAYRALKVAALSQGQWVAVVGAGGGLGHLAVQYAKSQGLNVVGIDGGEGKRSLCTRLGADAYVDFTRSPDIIEEVIQVTQGGAHGVLVMSSSPKAYEQALGYVRKAGTLVCIGITPTKMQFPIGPEYFVAKAVRLTGVSTGTMEDTQRALEYVSSKKVKPVVLERNLEHIPECLNALERGDVQGRFVVTFG